MHIPAPTSRSRLVISAQSSLPGHGDAASFILDLLGEALAILKKSIYCEQSETNLNPFPGRKARLDRHLLMAKRLFCCWAAALVAGFTGPADLPLILPSAWADGGASMAVSSASGLASSSQTTGKKQRTRKKHRALSPFVQLAQQITGDAPLCDHEAVIDDANLSSNGINCLSQDPGLRWVFTPSPWSGSGRWEDLAVESPNAGLRLQPLSVAFAPFSPWFPVDSVFFVGEDRLFEPLDPMGNTASRVAVSPPETPLDRHDPPFAYHLGLNRKSALIAGLGWIDDVSDTTGMTPAFVHDGGSDPIGTVGAVNLILGASVDAFTLTGGYLHAVERKSELDNDEADGNIDPTAWNSELAYRTRLLDRKTTLAVGYQKSSDSLSRYFPDERYTTRASILLFDATTLSLEYYQDRHDATENNLNGNDAYGITTKFGFDF